MKITDIQNHESFIDSIKQLNILHSKLKQLGGYSAHNHHHILFVIKELLGKKCKNYLEKKTNLKNDMRTKMVMTNYSFFSAILEKKILNNTLKSYCKSDVKFIDKLTTWADVIRKTYFDGGVDEIISTRRLVHITQAYSIFANKMKAIQMCTNRFDDDTKNSFVELYTKVDAGASADSIIESQKQAEIDSQIKEDNDSESVDEEDDKDVI